MEINEVVIPVPWGHVAGKTWGNVQHPPILVFHGILDNAGSFDRLMPLLPSSFYYVCIDLPGHGKSSHFAPHLPIHSLDYLIVYKIIMDYFKHDKYVIIGHSYGGQIGFSFAQIYPERVEKLIMLDTIHLFPVSANYFKDYIADKIANYLSIENKMKTSSGPTYTYEEALRRLQNNRSVGAITLEAAEALLQRSIVSTENGRFKFNMDQRLKNFINPLHDFNYVISTLEKFPVKCPVLIILGRESEMQRMFMRPLTKFLRRKRAAVIKLVDGSHDVHNNDPHLVAPYICQFLLPKSKL